MKKVYLDGKAIKISIHLPPCQKRWFSIRTDTTLIPEAVEKFCYLCDAIGAQGGAGGTTGSDYLKMLAF